MNVNYIIAHNNFSENITILCPFRFFWETMLKSKPDAKISLKNYVFNSNHIYTIQFAKLSKEINIWRLDCDPMQELYWLIVKDFFILQSAPIVDCTKGTATKNYTSHTFKYHIESFDAYFMAWSKKSLGCQRLRTIPLISSSLAQSTPLP